MIYFLSLFGVIILGGFLPYLLFWDKGRRAMLLALRSLWLNITRAFLSVLGVIIGTAAVIALMAFGEGSKQDALDDIKKMGATNIIIRSVKPPDEGNARSRSFVATYGLTYQDFEAFATVSTVTRLVPMRVFPQEIRHIDRMHNGRVVATTPGYSDINQLDLSVGRFLTWDDDLHMENVAVLGAVTATKLFPYDDPLGQTVRIGPNFYRVIGVCKDRMPTGGTGGSQAAEDFNNDVYIPLQTCKVRFGENIILRSSGSRSGEKVQLHQITLTVDDMEHVRPTGEVIRELIQGRHLKPDWAITVPLDRLEEAERTRNRYKGLLVLIASISLIVGGIGIMNIMLATVTERTREIGIRRALGAKRRDITIQFLVEAVVQTSLGGILGVILGVGIALLLPAALKWFYEYHLPVKIDYESILLSLEVAVGVGVIFGWYPAHRAARMDPIEALRHV
ncbi:MAG TPA: ABC transporter permease [Gemmataceae bacterium]|nr:ABC transporter permease [Gemmataceae bacterium]